MLKIGLIRNYITDTSIVYLSLLLVVTSAFAPVEATLVVVVEVNITTDSSCDSNTCISEVHSVVVRVNVTVNKNVSHHYL